MPAVTTLPTLLPSSSASSASPGTVASPQRGIVQVVIGTAPGHETSFIPDFATVASGDLVRLTFDNLSEVPHNLTFGEPIDALTASMIDGGMSETIEFTAPAPGDYQWLCTLHPWMVGTLTVTD